MQAVAAVVAIGFAWQTVVGARHAQAEQRRLADVARRERYFRQYVVDPAVSAVTVFREEAVSVLETTRTNREQLTVVGFGGHSIARAAERFERHLFTLREQLSFADSALGNTPLWPIVDRVLRDMEDAVAEGLNAVAAGRGTAVDFPGVIRQHCAQVLNAVYQHDLAAHTSEPPKARGLLAYLRAAVAAWQQDRRDRTRGSGMPADRALLRPDEPPAAGGR